MITLKADKPYSTLDSSHFFEPDGFPVAVHYFGPHPKCEIHRHPFFEIVMVTGGRGRHLIREEEYSIVLGDVFVVPGDTWHRYDNMENLAVFNILYKPSELGIAEWDIRTLPGYHALFKLEPAYRKQHRFESRLHLDTHDLAFAKGLVGRLQGELQRRRDGFRLMATALFMELVTFLSRCYGQSPRDPSQALLRIAQAITHIEDNYAEQIDIDTLAGIAHMSRRNFQRVFKEAMNCSPIEYLLRTRIQRATELLRDKQLTITQIAYTTGFRDSNYFSRQFKKCTGQTPRTLRT